MVIVIRADASTAIGMGHIQRCLTLADALRKQGATVIFICRELLAHSCNLIEEKGYRVYRLPFAESTGSAGGNLFSMRTGSVLIGKPMQSKLHWLYQHKTEKSIC